MMYHRMQFTRTNFQAQGGFYGLVLQLMHLIFGQTTSAQSLGTVDSTNFGVATEDAVISSAMPNRNLDYRQFNEANPAQQLLNTMDPDYPDPSQGALAREFIIFKFDFSALPAGAAASSTAAFDFSAWFTQEEGTPAEAAYGQFTIWEIVDGDPNWTDRVIEEAVENPNPVTWNSLNGTFVELSGVVEDNTDPPGNTTGNPFGVLYPGLLVSNGGFDGANRVIEIPSATMDRLITGDSVGLAIGSKTILRGDYDLSTTVDGHDLLLWQRDLGLGVVPTVDADGNFDGLVNSLDLQIWKETYGSTSPTLGTTNFSIHTTESFLAPLSAPTLTFEWTAPAPPLPVPEPGHWVTTLLAGMGLLTRRGTSKGSGQVTP